MSSKNVTNNKDLGKIGEMPTDEEMDKARFAITKARTRLLLTQPFFGKIMMKLECKEASKWCGTLATDGKHIYYNSKFVLALPTNELIFALAHELCHVIYDHLMRFREGQNDPQLSNVAADLVVNGDLVKHNVGKLITTIPILHDSHFYGMTYEKAYAYLDKRHRKRKDSGEGQGQGGSRAQGGPGSNPDTGDGELDDMIKKVLDQHLDGKGDENDPDNSDGENKAPRVSEGELEEFAEELKDAMRQAAQSCDAGDIPLGMRRLLDELQEPKVDWRELIQQQINSTIKGDFSWMKPSRRSFFSGVTLPGMIPEKTIDICITVDMSGSISQEQAKDFFSEIAGIMEMYENFKIHLWTFDTQVYNAQIFTSENIWEMEDYEPVGGGGTDFMCNWEWMEENDVFPEKLIMFTDGYPCGSWGNEDYCDTIFLIHGRPDCDAPFGITCHYEEYE